MVFCKQILSNINQVICYQYTVCVSGEGGAFFHHITAIMNKITLIESVEIYFDGNDIFKQIFVYIPQRIWFG